MAQNETEAVKSEAQARIDAVLSFLADIPASRECEEGEDENDANWEEAQIQIANDVRAILNGTVQTFY